MNKVHDNLPHSTSGVCILSGARRGRSDPPDSQLVPFIYAEVRAHYFVLLDVVRPFSEGHLPQVEDHDVIGQGAVSEVEHSGCLVRQDQADAAKPWTDPVVRSATMNGRF
jgi:hypothetical protein